MQKVSQSLQKSSLETFLPSVNDGRNKTNKKNHSSPVLGKSKITLRADSHQTQLDFVLLIMLVIMPKGLF